MSHGAGYIARMRAVLLFMLGCRVPPEKTSAECDQELDCVDQSGQPDCIDCDTTCQLDAIPPTSSDHVEGDVDYEEWPPAGGDHNRCWADWGVHEEELEAINFVHNQEHGGVIFYYNCPDGCAAEQALLTQLVQELGYLTILTPYSKMDHRFAVTAWGHRLLMNCLDLGAMESFYLAHVDQGPESTASMPPGDCMD